MNIFQKIGLAKQLGSDYSQAQKLQKQGAPVVKYIPLIVTAAATIASAIQAPHFVAQHALLYAILNAVAQVLHAVLPSVVAPKA